MIPGREQWHLHSESCAAVLQYWRLPFCYCYANLKVKFSVVVSSKETSMFKSLLQWITLFGVTMFLLHLRTFSINTLSLRPWLGNLFAVKIRFLWHKSIASNGIYQNYKCQHIEYFNTVLNCSYLNISAMKQTKCKCVIYSTSQQILHRRKRKTNFLQRVTC